MSAFVPFIKHSFQLLFSKKKREKSLLGWVFVI
jgi:hypothetical protein